MDIWKMKKLDAHIHILPEDVLQANQDAEDDFSFAKMAEHKKWMDKYHIEKAIIMPFNDPYVMSMEFTIEKVHENLIRMCEDNPERYAAFADVDVWNMTAEENCEELRKVLKHPCMKGIKLHPNNTEMNIDDTYNDGIFELAGELSVPIAIHSYPAGYRSRNREDFSAPKRILAMQRRHPETTLIITHCGGFQWEDCLNLNAYYDISAILPDWVEDFGIAETEKMMRCLGLEKLFFATDWPFSRSLKPEEIYPRYMEILEAMKFTEEELEGLFYRNYIRKLMKEQQGM